MLWFHCNAATGAIVTGGSSPNVTDARLNAPVNQDPDNPELIMCIVPDGTVLNFATPNPDFTPLREALREQINDTFNAFVRPMVSDLVGQDRRYSKKEVEAIVWTEGDEAAHPEKYPYMLAEAAAKTAVLGEAVTVAEIRAGIMEQIAQSAADPVIEGYRVAHRQAVLEAETLPTIIAAANVNWPAILAALQN